jgi:hypothetical protein
MPLLCSAGTGRRPTNMRTLGRTLDYTIVPTSKGNWFYPREDVESAVRKDVLEEICQIMYPMRVAHLVAICLAQMKLLLVAVLEATKLAS